MASSSRVVAAHRLLVVAAAYAAVVLGSSAQQPQRGGCFSRLFSFGDSIIDNGNWLRYFASSPGTVANPPYGDTFFHRPTGRFCDGRVIIDHIADALGIPFLTPYLAGNSSQDYANGTNFAVGGATALDRDFFTARNIDDGFVPYSLQGQMDWFKNVTRMLSSDEQGLSDLMASSLFLVGEIGGNDYNRALFRGKSADEVSSYVADVVAAISASVTELIGLGAKTVLVPGNFPIGCSPGYLTMFQTNDTAQYDSTGCLRWANRLAELHNAALKAALANITRPDGVAVVYADYYAAVASLVADPVAQGFSWQPLVACCGGGGPYNVDFAAQCGATKRSGTPCQDPGAAVSWDGFHFTDRAYKVIADGVLRGTYAVPPVHIHAGSAGC